MELTSRIGESFIGGLAYVGALVSLAGRAGYFAFVAPLQGRPAKVAPRMIGAM